MKLNAIVAAIAWAGLAGVATAGQPARTGRVETLPAITVSQAMSACARQDRAANSACDVLYQLAQANFTPRELRMVVAWETAHPQYLFDRIYELHDRYEVVVQGYAAALRAADDRAVAAK